MDTSIQYTQIYRKSNLICAFAMLNQFLSKIIFESDAAYTLTYDLALIIVSNFADLTGY